MKNKSKITSAYKKLFHEKFTRKLYVIYGIVILFLIFLFKRIGTQEVLGVLKTVNYAYLGLAGILVVGVILVRAYRLYLMLLKVKKVSWKNILQIQIITQTVGVYTTGFAESIKALPIKVAENIPTKKSIEVFVLEKTFDFFSALIVLILSIPYIHNFFPSVGDQLLKVSGAVFFAVLIAGIYFFEKRYKNISYLDAIKVGIVTIISTAFKLGAIYLTFLAIGASVDIFLLFVIYSTITIVPFIAIVPFGLGIKEPVMILIAQVTVGIAAISAFTILINAIVFGTYTIMSIYTLFCFSRK